MPIANKSDTGRMAANSEGPPLSCFACARGPFTVYGTTHAQTPGALYARRRELRHVPAGRNILKAGDTPSTVAVLYSGWAFRYRQAPDGRRQILSFIVPSDILLLETLCFPPRAMQSGVQALTPIWLCEFTLEGMGEILHGAPEQERALEAELHRQMAARESLIFDLGRRTARGRLARLLIEMKDRLARRGLVEDGRFFFPPRQEHLADALGLTTVYVNRTLVQLREAGIIHFERRYMQILLEDQLCRIAEDE